MKTQIGRLVVMMTLSIALGVGCNRQLEVPVAPLAVTTLTVVMTATGTSTQTATSTSIWTATRTATDTLTFTPTSTSTSTSLVGNTSTPTGTPTATHTGVYTITPSATPSSTPTGALTATPSDTPTTTPTGMGSSTATTTPTPTDTPTDSATSTASDTATASATSTATSTPESFLTPQVIPQATVDLGAASTYAVLAYSQVTNSGASTLFGDLGLDPGTQVDGGIVMMGGGVTHMNDSAALAAEGALGIAYTDAMGRPSGATLPAGVDLGGLTLYPGVYTCAGNINLSSGDLTLSAPDSTNTVFIFQVTGSNNLIIGPGRQVILAGFATTNNIYWAVSGYCSLDTSAQFFGTIMTYTSVTLNTGAVLNGRALAETGNVTLLANTITDPTP